MFYAYVISGILVTIAAGFLLPVWAFCIYLLALLAILVALPSLLGRVLDPRNAEIIRSHCKAAGISDVTIRPFPSHYGVRFRANDRRYYARCTVAGGKVRWKGTSPAELIGASRDA